MIGNENEVATQKAAINFYSVAFFSCWFVETMKPSSTISLLSLLVLALTTAPFHGSNAFSPTTTRPNSGAAVAGWGAGSTTTERTKTAERVNQQQRRRKSYELEEGLDEEENVLDLVRREGPLEYLQDDDLESRDMEDPFHILLMGSTFEKPKITVMYVSGSLEYVLDMPSTEAVELSKFAQENGLSCLGTWTREECLSLGKQLQVRDIVCRVVPFCEGGQRGWQAKDASTSNSGYAGSGASSESY